MGIDARLDRLARATRDLLDIAEQLKQVEAGLRSLHEPQTGPYSGFASALNALAALSQALR